MKEMFPKEPIPIPIADFHETPRDDYHRIPININQFHLMRIFGKTLEQLGLKGIPKSELPRHWRENGHWNPIGVDLTNLTFIGAFVESDDGRIFYLLQHDGMIDIVCGHNIYLFQDRDDILKTLGLKLEDYWVNPYVEKQIRKEKLGKWRLIIQYTVLLGLLIWQPFWFFAVYCAISYVVMTWMIFSGELVAPTERSLLGNILVGALTILLAPIFFAWFLFFAAFAII